MSRRYGNHGYFHTNWKATEAPLLIRRGASVDHVVAHTRGGTHTIDNFVSACWDCNVRKNDNEGWTPRDRPEGGSWDGMLAVFVGIAGDQPDDMEKKWLRAIDRCGLLGRCGPESVP
jgi:hypothetical protein